MATTDDTKSPVRVLATLNVDGSRRWLRPKLSPGRFLLARRVVAWALIAIFIAIPYITINGHPAMLLNIIDRKFHLFGMTFEPTDGALLALLILATFFGIFMVTALFGRVWCGWACPQTVYMEFVYRPIERFFIGGPGVRARFPFGRRAGRIAMYAVFVVISAVLAHIFLAYFVGVERLGAWMTRSPLEHPITFLVMVATTGLMMFDFAFFREQTCLVACPYGRIQGAMLDRHSLIITYDKKRGEPRGKLRKNRRVKATPDRSNTDVRLPITEVRRAASEQLVESASKAPAPVASGVEEQETGDCIDCKLCVTTCPTGIDIRDGLQMECIGCAQCIDACDAVMTKVGRPTGLIRYSSQAAIEGQTASGKQSLIRPRMFVYPSVMGVLVLIFALLLGTKAVAEVRVLPRQGMPFYTLPESGAIANQVRLRIVNRSGEPQTYAVTLVGPASAPGATLMLETPAIEIESDGSENIGFIVALPAEAFDARGRSAATLRVSDGDEFSKLVPLKLLGPVNQGGAGVEGSDE